MAKVIGNAGAVLATSTVAGIRQWEITYEQDEKDTTDFGANGVASYIMGISRWSGSFRGFKDGAPLSLSGATAITATFKESATTGQQYSGSIFIKSMHPVVEAGEVVSIEYGFVGTGTLTIATA